MFLREIKSKGRRYLWVVKSYRQEGKVKQKSIFCLGRIDNLKDTSSLKRLALKLLKICGEKNCFDITKLKEKERKLWAGVVVKKLWNLFSLSSFFDKLLTKRKLKFNLKEVIFLMVLDRLLFAQSKLKVYLCQYKYPFLNKNWLQYFYRSLDILAEEKEELELYLFEKNKTLFNLSVDIVFYDTTTFYFESQKQDELRDFGFSRDNKTGNSQVVFGLIIDKEARPIGFDVFRGNTFDGKTLKTALNKLTKRFNIRRLIIVSDRGLISKNNIEMIKLSGYEYIIGSKIKNKDDFLKEEILNTQTYQSMGGEGLKYKVIELSQSICPQDRQEKWILFYSAKKAEEEREMREELIERVKKYIESQKITTLIKRGVLKFIELDLKNKPEILEEKVNQEARWDGILGIETNASNLSAQAILEIYHSLYKIEESFRFLKSHLRLRPIYHWTPKRIKGHFVLCFIAFLLERTLELKLKEKNISFSPQKIREALLSLQYSHLNLEGNSFYLRSKVENLANNILRVLRIPIPASISFKEDPFLIKL